MLTKNGGGDHKRRLSRVHYICTMHCVQCTLEKQCTAHHVIIKDLSMVHRALWDRKHEGATRIGQCTRRVKGVSCIVRSEARRGHEDQSVHVARSAECTDWSSWPLSASDLTMHDTSCLNPIMTWIILFWYITKPKFASEVPNYSTRFS